MGSLKDFIAEQAERLRTEEPRAARKRDEWIAAVDRLNGRTREWFAQADPDQKVLEIRERPSQLREEGIGNYEIRGLSIGFGPTEVRVEPVARNVAGPHSAIGAIHINRVFGCVDLTDGLKKFMIFRLENEPEDRWSIIEQDGFRMRAFDQSAFEDAFQSLLD